MPAQTSVLGVLGHCRCAAALLLLWAFFSSPEKECVVHMRSYSWEELSLDLGDNEEGMVKQGWLQWMLSHTCLFPQASDVRQLWCQWDNPALALGWGQPQYSTFTGSLFIPCPCSKIITKALDLESQYSTRFSFSLPTEGKNKKSGFGL